MGHSLSSHKESDTTEAAKCVCMHTRTHTHTQILDFQWRKGFVSVLLTDVSQGPMKALATQMLACACSVAK